MRTRHRRALWFAIIGLAGLAGAGTSWTWAPPLFAQVQKKAAAPEAAPSRDNRQYILFIHTGGGSPEQQAKVADVLKALLAERFSVRAPDDQKDVVGGPGVDYFADQDQQAAQSVADIVNRVLQQSQSKPLVPRLQRVRNPPFYLGVWLF